jgi:Na+/proline symporter
MLTFTWGGVAAASLVAAVLFLRFWVDTRDRLFAGLAAGFAVLSANYVALAWLRPDDETRHLVYLVRLLAFSLILAAVVDKNLRAR